MLCSPKTMLRNGFETWRKSPNKVSSEEFKEGCIHGYSATVVVLRAALGAGETVCVC